MNRNCVICDRPIVKHSARQYRRCTRVAENKYVWTRRGIVMLLEDFMWGLRATTVADGIGTVAVMLYPKWWAKLFTPLLKRKAHRLLDEKKPVGTTLVIQ